MRTKKEEKRMVLVLGSGFLGTAIYNSLHRYNYQAGIFSKSILHNPGNGFFKGNLDEIKNHADVFDDVGTVIHAIHTTVPVTSMKNMVYDVESNVSSTIKLLEVMNYKHVKRIIFISSGGVIYGVPKYNLLTENHPTNPISSYGITKLIIEKYLQLYQYHYNFKVTILRPSNVYGKGQRLNKPQGVIGYLVDSILNDKEAIVWGDGFAKKDYLYIDDFTDAIIQVVSNPYMPDSPLYNLSYGKSYHLLEVIHLLEKLTSKKLKIKFEEKKKHDVSSLSLDNTLFKTTYNWEPKISVEEGLSLILKNNTPSGKHNF